MLFNALTASYLKACLTLGDSSGLERKQVWTEIAETVFVPPPGHGAKMYSLVCHLCRTLRPIMAVQGQTAGGSCYWNTASKCSMPDHIMGMGKGETFQSEIQIPKELGQVCKNGWFCLFKMLWFG